MVTLVLSSLSCCLKMAKIKAKQAREPVLKKNWRPMNLGKSEEPLNSGPPPIQSLDMLGLGAVGSAIITHYAVETLRPCQGEASSLRAVDPVTMALAGEAGEPLKLIPMGVLPWKVGKDLKREPWVGGEAWASPLSCPDCLMAWAGPASL